MACETNDSARTRRSSESGSTEDVGSLASGYSRHKEYTWRETFWAGLYCLDRLPPHGTGHKGFDWRWLAQTLRKSFKIVHVHKLPSDVFPTALSTSVFFVAEL